MGNRLRAIGGNGVAAMWTRLIMMALGATSTALVSLLAWNASSAFKKLGEIDTAVTAFMAQTSERASEYDRQFGSIDARLTRHTDRLDKLDHDVTTMQAQMPLRRAGAQ